MRIKRNLIQEIKRINSINLDKRIITEQEGPILDLITALVRKGSKDTETNDLLTQLDLNRLNQGKQFNLLGQLRKSADADIVTLIKSVDKDIIQEFQNLIPRVAEGSNIRARIIQDLKKGISEEDTMRFLSDKFKTIFGDYATVNFTKSFNQLIQKTYDDVSSTMPLPKPPKPQPIVPPSTDVSSIIRKFFRELISKTPRVQTEFKTFQKSASEKVNRIKELLEEYSQPEMEGVRLQEINKEIRKIMVELGQEDKNLVDVIDLEIENGLSSSIGSVKKAEWRLLKSAMTEIKKDGGDFTFIDKIASPISDVWTTIKEAIKYGLAQDRNVAIKASKVISNWFPNLSTFSKGLREIQGVDVKDLNLIKGPFEGTMNFLVTAGFPGSMRGIPLGAPRQEIIKVGNIIKSKTDLASGYKAIYDLQKNSKTKAWSSLAIEKIIKVVRYQLYFGVLNTIKSWVLFLYESDEELQSEYRDCIEQVGEAMARGDISLNESPDPEMIPSCLINIEMGEQEVFNFPGSSYLFSATGGRLGAESYTKKQLIQAILIRAYLIRGAEDDEVFQTVYNFTIRPVIESIANITVEEAALGFFTGWAPNWIYEIATNYAPDLVKRIIRGGESDIGGQLTRMRTEAEEAAADLRVETGIDLNTETTTEETD